MMARRIDEDEDDTGLTVAFVTMLMLPMMIAMGMLVLMMGG